MTRKVLAVAATCLFAALVLASPLSAAQTASKKSSIPYRLDDARW